MKFAMILFAACLLTRTSAAEQTQSLCSPDLLRLGAQTRISETITRGRFTFAAGAAFRVTGVSPGLAANATIDRLPLDAPIAVRLQSLSSPNDTLTVNCRKTDGGVFHRPDLRQVAFFCDALLGDVFPPEATVIR